MKKNKLYSAFIFGVLIIGFLGWTINKTQKTTTATAETIQATAVRSSTQQPENSMVELKDANGNPVNFSDFKGKIVFVNNWATWCRPCTMEMPSIQKLKENFSSKELVFVMISYDRDPQKSIQWMKNQGYTLPVYIRGKDLPREFITRGIPATFILDKKGEMIYKHVGMSDYSSADFMGKMKKWLAE